MMADYHVHTKFSIDSEALPEEMVKQAIAVGLSEICITDHYDNDNPKRESFFDNDEYFTEMRRLQEKYRDDIGIRIGVELGLQPSMAEFYHEYVNKYPFDFVIGSSHLVNGYDPYYPKYFEGKVESKVYRDYFEQLLENIEIFSEFQVVGHIDYIVRYGKNKAKYYSYHKYADIIDEILKTIISKNLGIEVNTAGFKAGLGFPNPHPDIVRRYKELGGEIITVGSDAHRPEFIGNEFDNMKKMLKDIGFDYITKFVDRQAEFYEI